MKKKTKKRERVKNFDPFPFFSSPTNRTNDFLKVQPAPFPTCDGINLITASGALF